MDTLVVAQGHQAETTMEVPLQAIGVPVTLAGDCCSPRSAEEAVYEGMMAGRNV